jgi:hypothetical protein
MQRQGIHPVACRILAAALILCCGSAAGFGPDIITPADASNVKSYTLYFPSVGSGKLVSVIKSLPIENGRTDQLNALVQALVSTEPGRAMASFPQGLGVRQVFVDRAGTVYVDLTLTSGRLPASDAAMERLCIWSVVNTLCYNFTDVRQVKVLIGGDEAETLFGHVDLSRPLLPDPRLIEEHDR